MPKYFCESHVGRNVSFLAFISANELSSEVVNLKNSVQIEVSMSVVFVSLFDDDKRVVSSVKLDYFFFYLNIPKKQGENLGQCETEFSGSRLIYRSSFSNWCDEM